MRRVLLRGGVILTAAAALVLLASAPADACDDCSNYWNGTHEIWGHAYCDDGDSYGRWPNGTCHGQEFLENPPQDFYCHEHNHGMQCFAPLPEATLSKLVTAGVEGNASVIRDFLRSGGYDARVNNDRMVLQVADCTGAVAVQIPLDGSLTSALTD